MKKKQHVLEKNRRFKIFAAVQIFILVAIVLVIAHSFHSFLLLSERHGIDPADFSIRFITLIVLLVAMILICLMMFQQNYKTSKYTKNLEENTEGLEQQVIDQWNLLDKNTRYTENLERSRNELEQQIVDQWNQLDKNTRYTEDLEKSKSELERQVIEQWNQLDKKNRALLAMQESVIEGMATIIEYRDVNTGMHVQKTKRYVKMITDYLYDNELHTDEVNERFVSIIGNAAAMHDIGKIAISDRILNKPGKFTDEEYEIMKNHTVLGAGIVRQIFGNRIDEDMLRMCTDVVQYHHEKWNGTGYPFGLSGTEIPLSARIMAIADVFDACVSRRVYKDKIPVEEVFDIIKKDAGTHFDPELAEIFVGMKDEIKEYLTEMAEKEKAQKRPEFTTAAESSTIQEI